MTDEELLTEFVEGLSTEEKIILEKILEENT